MVSSGKLCKALILSPLWVIATLENMFYPMQGFKCQSEHALANAHPSQAAHQLQHQPP